MVLRVYLCQYFLLQKKPTLRNKFDFVLKDGNIDLFRGFLAVCSRRDNF